MTSTTPGGFARRSFLTSAIAVAAGSMLAGGVVVTAASSASAATGATVTWHISSEPGNQVDSAMRGYANMLNAVRQAVRGGRLPVDGALPVDVTDINGTSQYISIDLHAEDNPEFIRVFMRRSDSYIMGWRQGGSDIGGVVDWGNGYIYTLDESVRPLLPDGTANPARLPGSTGRNTDTRYETLANYNDLAQQGATREGMTISPASLNTAVRRLNGGPQAGVPTRDIASSVLQIIVGVAEASRFRRQAADTAMAFSRGAGLTITATHMAFQNNWGRLSRQFLLAVMAGTAVFAAPVEIAGIIIGTTAVAATWLMTAHHSSIDSRGKHLSEDSLLYVSSDGTGDHWTVQAAIDAVPDSGANTILINKGIYHEVISVPKDKSWLTIKGLTGNREDVIIYNTRCHGMINPATGAKYGTQGSAVATFRPPNLTVKDLTISNGFDRAAHPEIDPYETQAVAVAAMGDRQVYDNVAIMSRQDTLLVKGETPTTLARQYFYNCFVRGDVDFVFGNATAVIDRSTLQMLDWPGGTVVAPNTDYRKKYGILITHSNLTANGLIRTKYLGRPWHNTAETWPQALVRDSTIVGQFNDTQPWTNMMPDYPWQSARLREYNNSGLGAGQGTNAPKLTDTEAADYTARKYLAGTDGWNPVR